MNIEYEVRVLEIDVDEIVSKLKSLGAIKLDEWEQRRFVYDTKPKHDSKWFRLRTNGDVTTLTYKNVEKNTIDGTYELEIEVSDFDKTNELLELMGYIHKGYQENKRIRYMLNGVEIDIDSWPLIPTYMEVEGKSEEEVKYILAMLSVDEDKVTTLNCYNIYKQIYDINLDEIKVLKF